MGVPQNHPFYFRMFHSKPFILGYPHLWNPQQLGEEYTDEPIQKLISSQGITLVCQHAVWDLVCRARKASSGRTCSGRHHEFCAQNDNQNCLSLFFVFKTGVLDVLVGYCCFTELPEASDVRYLAAQGLVSVDTEQLRGLHCFH